MKIIQILLVSFILSGTAFAQSAHSFLRDGDRAYNEENFTKAEEDYRKSLGKKLSTKGFYNLGNSIYNQRRHEEAIKHYQEAVSSAKDPQTKARAFHNLGNAQFQGQQLDKSVEAYKNALRLNPDDLDTKKNLAMAMRLLQQQQQQSQQSQKGEDSEEQQKQPPQESQPRENENPSEENSDPEKQPIEQRPREQDMEEKDLNKEEARQLLQIMEQEEQKVQQKLRKALTKPSKSEKDW